MSLAEGVQGRVAYKAYSTGVITSNTQPTSSSDPGAAGAQILRRTETSIQLAKDTYQSNEIRSDRQIADFRHGVRRVSGSLSGEWSPNTYWDLFEAALRGTAADAITADESDLTSAEADNSASTFTFGGGNPVTVGFRVGMIIRFTNLADADNNAKNFLITGFSGASNRTVAVYPAPDTMSADSAFSVASQGQSLYMPQSSFVQRKFGIELYNEDIDVARLYTECRIAGFNLQLPATGLATVEFPVMGRDMETYSGTNAPFFTSPSAATSTGIFAAVNGLIRVGGTNLGVVTGLNISADLSPSSDAVVGQNFVPEVFLGRLNVTGQVTAFFEDLTLVNYFKNETEVEILCFLTTTTADASPAASVYLPRVKLGGADVQNSGEGGQQITMPIQALFYTGAGAGIQATTIQFCDTQAS